MQNVPLLLLRAARLHNACRYVHRAVDVADNSYKLVDGDGFVEGSRLWQHRDTAQHQHIVERENSPQAGDGDADFCTSHAAVQNICRDEGEHPR